MIKNKVVISMLIRHLLFPALARLLFVSAFFFSALKINLVLIFVQKMINFEVFLELDDGFDGENLYIPPPWTVPQLRRRAWHPENVNDGSKMIGAARSPDRSRCLSCRRRVNRRLLLQLAAQLLRLGRPPPWRGGRRRARAGRARGGESHAVPSHSTSASDTAAC